MKISYQNGNFIPGGKFKPPDREPSSLFMLSEIFFVASLIAAVIRSSKTSFSSAFKRDSSMLTLQAVCFPFIVTLTNPPPEMPSTSVF